MKIDKENIDVLLVYICHACGTFEEKDKKIIEEVINCSKEKLEKLSGTTDIDVEYFITYVLTELGITYYYYEGVKKGYGFRTFIAHVKKSGVLSVMSKAHMNKNETQDRLFYEITYKDKKYYVNNKRISKIGLRKMYFLNRQFLSNECFIIDSFEMEKMHKAIKRNNFFHNKVDTCLV